MIEFEAQIIEIKSNQKGILIKLIAQQDQKEHMIAIDSLMGLLVKVGLEIV